VTSLLREHSVDDLGAMRALPAPAQYADDISGVLARRTPDAIRLAGAMAVLGSGRIGRFEAVTVAGMPDREVADRAIRELVDAGLVAVEEVGVAPSLRWAHALTATAVYQQLEPPFRRELHGRASTVVTSESARFEHRMRAVVGANDELADDLERAAGEHHRQRGYRVAAQYLRWAQVVTADVEVRHRRRLDGCFEALLARELTTVRDELPSIIDARHDERRTLVVGALHCFEGNYHDGVQVLSAIATWPPDTGDALTRHRIEMLLAWARTLLGHDVDLIAAGLERAAALHATDPAMTAYGLLARGHVAGRTQGWDQFLALIDQLPEAASATPPQLSGLLVWRGQDYLSRGLFAEAASDLREVQHRQHDGVVDALSNGFDSMLAAAYWFAGRWQLASVTFRGAREAPAELVGLLTSALSPMAPSAAGDFAEADRLIAEGAAVLEQRPWPEAVEVHLAALVVRRHAGGVREAQAGLMAEFRTRWPHTPIGAGFVSGVWAVHLALAQLWADELQAAEVQLDRAAGVADPGASLHAMERWVRGLLHEARGRSEEALQHLRTATAVGGTQGPLYRAHALADRARIARALGSGSEAASSLCEALALYQELGAAPYIERLTQQADQAAVTVAPSSVESYVVTLTEREHDVLALVVEGYSYAQIARQLYISQSTVSYHLGNIYPKAGVRSRHELTQWVRAHPGSVRTSAKG
jgi:DNA-binding CsgD family transcriptional regulator